MANLLAKYGAPVTQPVAVAPPPAEYPPLPFLAADGVGDSEDLRRILAIPRRTIPDWQKDAERLSAGLRIDTSLSGCKCTTKFRRACCKNLRPVQASTLGEIARHHGLLGPIGVGHGKSLLDLLAPMVIPDCKVAVLLVPANLKQKLLTLDVPFYGQHWKLPNVSGGQWIVPGRPTLYVFSYEEFSRESCTTLLTKLRPDTIILDEAHYLKNPKATRTTRFLRFMRENPQARLMAWSGTLTSRSVKDYAHLARGALRNNSPLPHHWPVLDEWSAVLDGDPFLARTPGNLVHLCRPGERIRDGFQRRLLDTPGVVRSNDAEGCQASLLIQERPFKASTLVQEQLQALEATWERPDGEAFAEAMQVATCERQLACGFYYKWRFPRKEPHPLIKEWLRVRKEWHKEVREKLKHPAPHMDSPLLVTKAAIRWFDGYVHIDDAGVRHEVKPKTRNGPRPVWASEYWQEWKAIRDSVQPETEAVWFDESLVEDAAMWLEKAPGLAWYEFDTVGQKLAGKGFSLLGPGKAGNLAANSLTGKERCVVSIAAHGTGKDLQVHNRNLVLNPPSGGAIWEQLVGRTHRPGQLADEVTVDVYRHTPAFRDAIESARKLADYIESTLGTTQKLVSRATWGF